MMNHMKQSGISKIEAEKKSEDEWKENILKLAFASLLPSVDSVGFLCSQYSMNIMANG
jgi:hypothetical protein